ncbi:MAG: ABC transporter ATP-binding protein [Desulfurococcales archaeon]|nr:ABC transporter ATP-binding protein [Desulfurococcales archaeon]
MGGGDAVVVEGLVKRYGDTYALKGLSFTVARGEVYGLLGPNGAGKTTTLRAIAGALRPTRGRILVEGVDPAREPLRVKRLVGVVPELPSLFPELTVRDNLEFIAGIYGFSRSEARRRARETAEALGLGDYLGVRYGRLSKGLKRRVDIAAALIHDPPILLLDEPTSGLDVIAASRLRERIAALARQGKTVVLSSHYIEEVMALADRALILYRGSKIVEGTPAMLRRVLSKKRVTIYYTGEPPQSLSVEAREALGAYGVEDLKIERGALSFKASRTVEALEASIRLLRERGLRVVDVEVLPPSWDDVFKAHIEAAGGRAACPCGGRAG